MAEWEDWSLMDAILSQDIQRALAALDSAEGIQLEAAAVFFLGRSPEQLDLEM